MQDVRTEFLERLALVFAANMTVTARVAFCCMRWNVLSKIVQDCPPRLPTEMEQSRKDSLRKSRYMGSTGDRNKIIRILLQSMTLRTNR